MQLVAACVNPLVAIHHSKALDPTDMLAAVPNVHVRTGLLHFERLANRQPLTPPTPLCRFVCTEWGGRHQRRSLPLNWCRYVDSAGSNGITSQHFAAGPSLAQPWQLGRLQRPAAVLRQPLLSCVSVVAHRAGARVRGAALPHRLYAARTLA